MSKSKFMAWLVRQISIQCPLDAGALDGVSDNIANNICNIQEHHYFDVPSEWDCDRNSIDCWQALYKYLHNEQKSEEKIENE